MRIQLPAISLVILIAVLANSAFAAVTQKLIDAPPAQRVIRPGYIWPSTPPSDCPFPPSATLKGIRFTGRHAQYTHADTWYPSWASDGNMYSSWTDGSVNGVKSNSGGPDGHGCVTGYATIVGDDPLKLRVINQGIYPSDATPYQGRYPSGNLVYNGVWYYGTYCLGPQTGVLYDPDKIIYVWPMLGPFVGFRYSSDQGKTWTQTSCTPDHPLFEPTGYQNQTIKIGTPHFVDFGQNMQFSPDGKAYLVADGAPLVPDPHPRFAHLTFAAGDAIYLLRVTPSVQNINDASKYEFFAGRDAQGQAIWSHDLKKIQPIAQWNNRMGCVTMTYDAPLKKYLMFVTDGGSNTGAYHTYLLESDQITGAWRLVTYMHRFGEQAYFVNVPSKFIAPDGRTLWLCYAANFSNGWLNNSHFKVRPPGSAYAMCLQQVNLLSPADAIPPPPSPNPLDAPENLAPRARVTVTSTAAGYQPWNAVDGNVGGLPGQKDQEWASNGERDTAMLRLTWPAPVTVDRVWLFDRPNLRDQITSGLLVFSDGSTIPVGALPNNAKQGVEVKFDPKTITWLAFMVNSVSRTTTNVGLSEIAVFRAR